MALEGSPRLSFSNDPSPSPTFRLDDSLPVDDFDFSTGGVDSLSTPADLLFSQGRLLPFYNSSSPQITKPKAQTLRELLSNDRDDNNDHGDASCISVGSNIVRSSSVSRDAAKTSANIRSLSRSKSTGCNPSKSRAKAYYYSGGDRRPSLGNGVRINPVINVPAPFIPRGGSTGSSGSGGDGRSFFTYLLCNCRDKTMEMSLGL